MFVSYQTYLFGKRNGAKSREFHFYEKVVKVKCDIKIETKFLNLSHESYFLINEFRLLTFIQRYVVVVFNPIQETGCWSSTA